jgi:hypothetical protein
MSKYELGDVIAERRLQVTTADGAIIEIVARIGRPIADPPDEGHPTFTCPWQIKGFGGEQTRAAHGGDAVEALAFAFEMIGIQIEYLQAAHTVRIEREPGFAHGFPTSYWPKDDAASPDSHADAAE